MDPEIKKLLDSFRTGVIKVCDLPNLRIRKFPKSENPDFKTLNLLRKYAYIGHNDLTDFNGARYYLKRGDLYLLRINETIYFYFPLTSEFSSNKSVGKISDEEKKMIVETIKSNCRELASS